MGLDAFVFLEYFGFSNYGEENWISFAHMLTDRPDARDIFRVFDENPSLPYSQKGVPKDAGGQVIREYTKLIVSKPSDRVDHIYEISEQNYHMYKEEFYVWDETPTRVYMKNLFDTWLSYTEVELLANQLKQANTFLKLDGCAKVLRVLSQGNEENARLIMWIN